MKEKPQDQRLLEIIAERTLDEQIECIRKYGNHGITPVLRSTLLKSLGITMPKQNAKNLLMFGCYIPFMYPQLLRDYIKILDLLGVEYSYLEEEHCCGMPMIFTTTGAEREKAMKAGKEFMQMNRDIAQQKGATNIVYSCIGCAHAAKGFFPDEAAHHMYYFSLIIDKLEKKTLSIAPTVMGYYEGCQIRYNELFPEVSLDWGRCRQLLDRIEGLEIVDLPHKICCAEHSDRIVETAEKQNLDTILCSCNGCYGRINTAAQGRMQVKYLTDVLLEVLSRG